MDFLYPDGYIFQQVNAPCHKSRIEKKWFEDNRMVVMDWPAMSSDLSPIENLWAVIKNKLQTIKCIKMIEWLKKINEI
jgi:hypothetical protein